MRRGALGAAATAVLVGGLLQGLAGPADAVGPVRFSGAQYNSPGSDNGTNSSLNAEWVRITNAGARAKVLTGWKVRDRAGHVFTFPTFRLGAGRSVRLHTGSGRNTATDLYWRQRWYIWNNTGDRAILRNAPGTVIDTCSWGDGPGYTGC